MLEHHNLEDLIRDLREKPFEKEISEFVINNYHHESRGSTGVNHHIDIILGIHKKKGCREEHKYYVHGGSMEYSDRGTDYDITEKDIQDRIEWAYKKIESNFPKEMVSRDGDKLIIKGGFLYIPGLKAYVGKHTLAADDRVKEAARLIDFKVCDDGHLTHINWHEAKNIVENLGSRMLKPAEFWIFYNHLRDKGILCDVLGKKCGGEWLDARISPNETIPSEDGVFNIGDINRETGLPNRLDGFECIYVSPKSDSSTASFHYKKDSHRPILDLSLSPDYRDYKLGVREVLDAPKVDVEEKGDKQLNFEW